MRIKDGFMTRKIGDKIVSVAVGERAREFSGMITLNETAEFIWKCMEQETTVEEIADKLAEKYGIDHDKAMQSCDNFIKILEKNELLA